MGRRRSERARGPAPRALIVANWMFPEDRENLPDLAGPPHDADAVAAALTDPQVGLFRPEDVQVLRQRFQHEVVAALEDVLVTSAVRDQTVLLYFSGHGEVGRHGQLFLCLRDTRLDRLHSTAIAASWIRDAIMDSPATVVVVLDCCASGRFVGHPTIDWAPMGSYVVMCVPSAESAPDAATRGTGSPFTQHLVEGLEKAPASGDGHLTMDDLFAYVQDALARDRVEGLAVAAEPRRLVKGPGPIPIARRSPVPAPPGDPVGGVPVLDLSTDLVDLGEVDHGGTLRSPRIRVQGGGGRWSVRSSASWVRAERRGDEVVLRLSPAVGHNRATVRVVDPDTGTVRAIEVAVDVRAPRSAPRAVDAGEATAADVGSGQGASPSRHDRAEIGDVGPGGTAEDAGGVAANGSRWRRAGRLAGAVLGGTAACGMAAPVLVLGLPALAEAVGQRDLVDVAAVYVRGDEPEDADQPRCSGASGAPGSLTCFTFEADRWDLEPGGSIRAVYAVPEAGPVDRVATLGGRLDTHLQAVVGRDGCDEARIAWQIEADGRELARGQLDRSVDEYDLDQVAVPSGGVPDQLVIRAQRADGAGCTADLYWYQPGYDLPGR